MTKGGSHSLRALAANILANIGLLVAQALPGMEATGMTLAEGTAVTSALLSVIAVGFECARATANESESEFVIAAAH